MRQNAKGRQAKSKAYCPLRGIERFRIPKSATKRRKSSFLWPTALGTQVIEFKNVTKSFGDRVLIDNLSMNIPAGAIVGIIGPNGAGKSTLFKLIAGREQPDAGEVIIGSTVKWPT